MKESGWYTNKWGFSQYYVVKPLKGQRQQLIMEYWNTTRGDRWAITMGIFPSQCTPHSIRNSPVWDAPTSTNNNASTISIKLALEALQEVIEIIRATSPYKKNILYIDGMDYRRLHAYTRILTKQRYGFKKSSLKSEYCNLPQLYKII